MLLTAAYKFIHSGLFPTNACRVTTWPALENVTERSDMTRFLQTLDMCAFRANVTRLILV
jgi:hypothetical protein